MKAALVALVVFSLFATAACGKTSDNASTVDTSETTPAVTETERLRPELPDADFDGYTFTVLCWHEAFDTEQENGEPINDAIYKRNSILEDRYNIDIVEVVVDGTGMTDAARTSIMAGDSEYDVIVPRLYTVPSLAESKLLLDLYKIPYLDFSKPWWDQRATEQLTIGNKLFFTVGDLNAVDNGVTFCIIFNKDLVTELRLQSPYELVRQGSWTMDNFVQLCREATADLNGDSVLDENDRWGFISEDYTTYMLCVGGGFRVTEKGSDNYPALAMNSERTYDIFAKAYDINYDTSFTVRAQIVPGDWVTTGNMFRSGQGLFFSQTLSYFVRLRDMESTIGLLPMPKYETSQDGYYNYVSTYWSSATAIPITTDNPERTGIILEDMPAESMYLLTPAFYEITLAGKALRDEDSEEMLSIILSSRAYDIGEIYDWGGVCSTIFNATRSRDFASQYAKIQTAVETAMERTLDKYRELD